MTLFSASAPLVELAVSVRCDLGEGPVWLERQRALVWVDITGHRLHRFCYEQKSLAVLAVRETPGALAPRTQGGLVLAARGGFFAVDEAAWPLPGAAPGAVGAPPNGTPYAPSLLCPLASEPPTSRMNDGRCDRSGRFWAGSVAKDFAPGGGTLYCLETSRTARAVLPSVTISNGLCFRADDRVMYYIDTPTQRVDEIEFDRTDGVLGRRRPLIEIPREMGAPDGMTIDADGCLWVALWGGGAVHRYTPAGELDRVIPVPARRVTSCTFGGPTLDELFITTASGSADDPELRERPHAGAVFVCRPGVRGLPADPYLG